MEENVAPSIDCSQSRRDTGPKTLLTCRVMRDSNEWPVNLDNAWSVRLTVIARKRGADAIARKRGADAIGQSQRLLALAKERILATPGIEKSS